MGCVAGAAPAAQGGKAKMGRSDFDKLELAPERAEPFPRHKMKRGRPYFDKLGLASFLKTPKP